LTVAVAALPRLSNVTDLDALAAEPGVDVRLVTRPGDLEAADLAVLPGVGSARSAMDGLRRRGLDDVLRALNERRVEVLVLDEQFSERGSQCPEDGWLGPPDEARCPVDGTPLVAVEDLTDAAIELALQQSAGLLEVRHNREAFSPHGGIAAVLRF
jgi:hypothetical protein